MSLMSIDFLQSQDAFSAPCDSYANLLSALVADLPREEVLSAALAIESESSRAQALSALAEIFPEAYKEALSAALAIQKESDRANALNKLIPQSTTFPTSQQFQIWQEILYQGLQRKLPAFLSDLAVSVSLIDKLGGKAAGIGIAKSIQQVAKWWR